MSDLIERLRGNVTEAALRLIAGAFRRDGEQLESNRRPRFSIPTRPAEDDDCVVIDALKEAATALSEAKAENERLTRERDKWFREAEERADACSLIIRERDGLREALKPFSALADNFHPFTRGDQSGVMTDLFHQGELDHFTINDFRRARAALNPKGGDNG